MKALITAIVKALVDQPEQVSVKEMGGAHNILLEVRVAKTDMGKVIGKRGRTAEAIRTIFRQWPVQFDTTTTPLQQVLHPHLQDDLTWL